jgi:hypothetical protein
VLVFFLKAFKACFCGHPLCTANRKKEVPAENDTLDVLVNIAKGGAPLHHLNSVLKINTVKEFNLFYKENPKALRAVSRPKQLVWISLDIQEAKCFEGNWNLHHPLLACNKNNIIYP